MHTKHLDNTPKLKFTICTTEKNKAKHAKFKTIVGSSVHLGRVEVDTVPNVYYKIFAQFQLYDIRLTVHLLLFCGRELQKAEVTFY